jgi:hypothetical protein
MSLQIKGCNGRKFLAEVKVLQMAAFKALSFLQ